MYDEKKERTDRKTEKENLLKTRKNNDIFKRRTKKT